MVDAAGDMAQASTDIQQAVLTAQSDTARDLADNDLALAYAEAYLAAEGLSLEAADNADPAPILGELLQVSDQDLAGLSSAIQSAELVLEPKSPADAKAQSVTQRLDLPTMKIEVTSVPSREDWEAVPGNNSGSNAKRYDCHRKHQRLRLQKPFRMKQLM